MSQPVQGPDGNIYQFPDGTGKDAAVAYFKKKGIAAPSGQTQTKSTAAKQPGYTGNFLKDTGWSKDEVKFHVPERGSEATISTMKSLAGLPAQLLAPPRNKAEEQVVTTFPEIGMPTLAAKRALIDPQVGEFRQFQQTHGLESALHLGASIVPIVGPMAAGAVEAYRQGEPEKAAYQGLMTAAAAHSLAPTVEKGVKVGKQAVAKGARSYAQSVATEATGLIPSRETGINVPGRFAQSVDKVTTLKKSVDTWDAKAKAASTEVQELATKATKDGVSHQVGSPVRAALDLLYRKSAQLRNMEAFGQTKFPYWENTAAMQRLTPSEGLLLRQDLDAIINYETKGGKETPVSKAAHQARTAIDQAYDKSIPGWKDANEKASSLIQAKDALKERAEKSERGLTVQGLFRLVPHKWGEVPEALAVGGATYTALQAAGVHGIINYIGSGTAVAAFRSAWDSLPSQTARIKFAEGLANKLVGERPAMGPQSYPPSAFPPPVGGPPGAGGGAPAGGPAGPGIPPQAGPQGGWPGGRDPMMDQHLLQLTHEAYEEAKQQATGTAKSEGKSAKSATAEMPSMSEGTSSKAAAAAREFRIKHPSLQK